MVCPVTASKKDGSSMSDCVVMEADEIPRVSETMPWINEVLGLDGRAGPELLLLSRAKLGLTLALSSVQFPMWTRYSCSFHW